MSFCGIRLIKIVGEDLPYEIRRTIQAVFPKQSAQPCQHPGRLRSRDLNTNRCVILTNSYFMKRLRTAQHATAKLTQTDLIGVIEINLLSPSSKSRATELRRQVITTLAVAACREKGRLMAGLVKLKVRKGKKISTISLPALALLYSTFFRGARHRLLKRQQNR